jgi:16S rRNA (guanine(527)-N(7))-methyltransferase RsmG
VDQRHLADSLLFATPLDHDPDLIWDIGSGVGLPGIPLAILMTDTEVVLIDRSERRVDLANRAIGVLGLDNVKVRQVDVEEIVGSFPTVVSRATLSPARMSELLRDRLLPGAMIIKGGSWTNRPLHPGWETLEIPPTVLDHTVWLLIMRRQ